MRCRSGDRAAPSEDLRRAPIEGRKTALGKLAHNAKPGLQLSVHLDRPGDVVFEHACKLGLEGIVSKRKGSRYRSDRSDDWFETNQKHPAATRNLENWHG